MHFLGEVHEAHGKGQGSQLFGLWSFQYPTPQSRTHFPFNNQLPDLHLAQLVKSLQETHLTPHF
jgi:hypothetical protein